MHQSAKIPLIALLLAACSPAKNDAPAPPAASTAAAIHSAPAASASAAPTATPTAEPTTAPYLPPPEDEEIAAPPSEPQEEPKRKTIGTFEDWVKAYSGTGAPEIHKRPPRLGLVKDLAIKKGLIAFERSGDIVTFDLATGAEKQLTQKGQRNIAPVFLADGKRIAFASNRDGMAWRVFSMNADGSDQHPITGKMVAPYGPSFAVSPDGRTAAYVTRERPQGWPSDRLHLVDVASGRDEPVGELDDFEDLMFSPNGDALYLAVGGFDLQQPAVVDVATKQLRRLPRTAGAMIDTPQRFGDRLLFSASPTASYCCRDSRLYTAALDGSDLQKLGPFEAPGSIDLVASPRGARIAAAWSVREGGFGADWRTDISVLDSKGIPIRVLAEAFPRPFYSAGEPTWAPDERHLAFTLSLCPYAGCEPTIRSVVVVDSNDPKAAPAFIGYGGGASWSPAP